MILYRWPIHCNQCIFPLAWLMHCIDAQVTAPFTHIVLIAKATCLICALEEAEYASTCSGISVYACYIILIDSVLLSAVNL